MPQTREHFDICRLLQVKSGLIALTKFDLVDEELLELARAEVEDFVKGSFLEGAPIIPVSSRTGAGIEELKNELVNLTKDIQPKTTSATPRLPVDRAFSVKGFGTVVTGTLIAGTLKVGDEIEVLPHGARTRIRNLQVHGHDTEQALAGQRTAVNLQGVSLEQAERGAVLSLANRLHSTSMLDVRLDLLDTAPRPLTHRARVRLHHGTSEVMARMYLIDSPNNLPSGTASENGSSLTEPKGQLANALEPGESDFVQLRLEEPIAALPGDRFIIRSYSPQITIGGGVILDALPQKHRRREKDSKANLERLEAAEESTDRIGIFIELAGDYGMSLSEIAARTGATNEQILKSAKLLIQLNRVLEISTSPMVLLGRSSYTQLADRVIAFLASSHKREPLALGVSREEVREHLFGLLNPDIFRRVISQLSEEKKIVAERDTLRLASHQPALQGADAEAKQNLEAAVKASGLQAGTLEEVATNLTVHINLARKLYNLLIAERRLLRIGEFIFHVDVIEDLKNRVRAYKSISSKIDVAAFKEITGGLTRKHAIPLLEFLDRERITRRLGNEREIL
jgi:selenocysteine-specific elongation factor